MPRFGDPGTDYRQALDPHYKCGPPPDWKKDYVSSYATVHAVEDWAETFAHYLHIRDALDTAAGRTARWAAMTSTPSCCPLLCWPRCG